MSDMNWWILLNKHWGKVLGAVIGLDFALLVINLGFWLSVFIFLCVAIGLLIGWKLDTNKNVGRYFKHLFEKEED